MSAVPHLTIAISPNDRVASLARHIDSAAIDATIVYDDPGTIFRSMLHDKAYDVSEMSFGAYTIEHSRGNRDLIALPVFTSKMFRHAAIYVRSESDLRDVAALAGRVVGVPEYQMTAAVWVRAFMQTQYGVEPRSVRWRTGGLYAPAVGERIALTVPPGYEIQPVTPGTTLEQGLLDGSLDAVVTARVPRPFSDGSGRMRRLLADPRSEELAYFQQTGVFPIMHVVVARTDAVERHPAIAKQLLEAFTRSKADAYHRLLDADYLSTALVWLPYHYESETKIFGPDPFAYGVADNMRTLTAFVDACAAQGLLERPIAVPDLFHPSTIE